MMKKLAMMMTLLAFLSTTALANAEEVYTTKNGKKYHKEICRLIKNKSPQKIDKTEALKKGLKPCQLCYKEQANNVIKNDEENKKVTKK